MPKSGLLNSVLCGELGILCN